MGENKSSDNYEKLINLLQSNVKDLEKYQQLQNNMINDQRKQINSLKMVLEQYTNLINEYHSFILNTDLSNEDKIEILSNAAKKPNLQNILGTPKYKE